MNNIQLWSRAIDKKILIVLGVACALALAAAIGLALPTAEPSVNIKVLNALITSTLLVFVWGLFRLVRPTRYSPGWATAEIIVVPLAWTMLVIALALWFDYANRD